MRLISIKCPECGASLDIPNERKILFCTYCGSKLALDDGSKTITHNYNHTYTERDEARICEIETMERMRLQEMENEERKEKRDNKIGLICGVGIPLLIILAIIVGFSINKGIAQTQGKISAGYYKDYIGEDYEAVVKQFEEMGFENIVAIDLNDSGVAFWNDGKVKSISIDGKDNFEDINYFYADDKVIIKYH